MLLVFCRDPLEPGKPDRTFGAEVAASERSGLPFVLVDHDALVRGDEPSRAVRRVPEQDEPALAVYRGWMLTPPQYGVLYDALLTRGVRLINHPDQYRTVIICPKITRSSKNTHLGPFSSRATCVSIGSWRRWHRSAMVP